MPRLTQRPKTVLSALIILYSITIENKTEYDRIKKRTDKRHEFVADVDNVQRRDLVNIHEVQRHVRPVVVVIIIKFQLFVAAATLKLKSKYYQRIQLDKRSHKKCFNLLNYHTSKKRQNV